MNGSSVNYRCVLAVVDLGTLTEPVLDRAVDLGRRCGATVDVANVLEGMPVLLYHAFPPRSSRGSWTGIPPGAANG